MQSQQPTSAATAADDQPSNGYAMYVLVLLTLVGVMNWMDRTVIAILLDPIKQDLGVSDTMMGLLNGFGFSLLYAITAIPVARLADRKSRKIVLAIGLTIWSTMTAACGLAGSFGQLLLARMAVGASESTSTPASQSIISDYFPPERRSVAFGIYASSTYFGTAGSALLGGYLGYHFGWRTALIAVSVPGILLALLVLATVREPERGRLDTQKQTQTYPLRQALGLLASHGTFRLVVIAMAVLAIVNGATLTWTPALLGRVHHLNLAQLGLTLALAKGLAGVIGTIMGGIIATRLAKGSVYGPLLISATVSLIAIPALILYTQSNSLAVVFASIAVYQILVGMPIGISFAAVQSMMPSGVRALSSATITLFTTLVGIGGGPLIIGALNDALTPRFGTEAVRYGLLALIPFLAVGVLGYWLAARDHEKRAAHR